MKKINPSVRHQDYKKLAEHYSITEDAWEGEVKEYVPYLTGQTQEEWTAYVNRAAYYNVVEKTSAALVGSMIRKTHDFGGVNPETEYGNLETLVQTLYRDILTSARIAVVVDVNDSGASELINFDADDIINWRGNGTEPGDFVMIETDKSSPNPDNPYETMETTCWQELYIDESGEYRSRMWYADGKDRFYAEELPQMLVNGQPLAYIPCWLATPYDNTWEVYNPPLLTQARLNIQHFKKAIDIAHLEHFMSIPTFTIIGDLYETVDSNGNSTRSQVLMGSTKQALQLTQGSDAKFVEVAGAGHSTLMESLKHIEEEMYASGSRLMTNRRGVESAEALQIRSGSESASLTNIVETVESALDPALALCAEIDRVAYTGLVLNRDFTASVLDPQSVSQLIQLYSTGAITLDKLLEELYANEVLRAPDQQNG